jgi:TPR repeat protein
LCASLSLSVHTHPVTVSEQQPSRRVSNIHDFSKLQAVTDQWQQDYEHQKINGDEYVERLAGLHPMSTLEVSPFPRLYLTAPNSDAERWIDKYPKSYAAHYLYGVALTRTALSYTYYSAQGSQTERAAEYEKYSKLAEAQFLKSVAFSSRPYPSYLRLIHVTKELGGGRQLDYFERALSIDPKAYAARAALLESLAPKWGGSIKEVHDAFARAKSGLASPDGVRKLEALKYEIMGEDAKTRDTDAAIEFYRRAYRTSPTPDTLWRLAEAGELARNKGYNERAIDLYGQVLAIDPTQKTARNMRAFVYLHRKNDLASAMADYLILAKAGDISAQNALGEIYMDGRQIKADDVLAASYFKMAAAQGNPTAVMKLRELEKRSIEPAAPAAVGRRPAVAAAVDIKARPGAAHWVAELEAHQFQKLQQMTDAWLQSYRVGEISGDDLIERMRIFYHDGSFKASWQKDVERWIEKYPDSYAANFVFGTMLAATAGKKMGGVGSAANTRAEKMSEFNAVIKQAEKQLLRSAALFSRPYPSYCALLGLSTNNRAKYYTLAVKADPKAFEAHSIRVQYLAPKWGGSLTEVDAAIAAAKASGMSVEDNRRIDALGYEIKAEDALARNDPVSAIALYRNSYFTAPGPTRLWRLMTAAQVARLAGFADRAIELYTDVIAIDRRHVRALMFRADLKEKAKRDPKAALADVVAAAELGDAGAQNRAGRMYLDGIGAEKNYDMAEAFYRKAEAQGDENSVRDLEYLATLRRSISAPRKPTILSTSIAPATAGKARPAVYWAADLEAHRFQQLQQMTEAWLQNYSAGNMSSDNLIERMQIFYPDGSFKTAWQKDVELWIETYPDSYAANYVLGTILAATAGKKMGEGAVANVGAENQSEYEAASKLAEKQMLHSVALFAKPYPSYCALIGISKNNRAEYYRLALKADPKAFEAHSIRVRYLGPKWGGSLAGVDAAIAATKASGMSVEDNRRVDALGDEIKADDALVRKDPVAAIALYRTAYLKAPGPRSLGRLMTAAQVASMAGFADRAIELYTEVLAIDKRNGRALVLRAKLNATAKRDPKGVLADVVAAAELGDADAQTTAGRMYLDGIGAEKNYDTAEVFLRKAEAQGNLSSLRELEYLATLRKADSAQQKPNSVSSSVMPAK